MSVSERVAKGFSVKCDGPQIISVHVIGHKLQPRET